jgi:Protein of unknown function (DUF2478)
MPAVAATFGWNGTMTFDAQSDLAALVYEPHQNPDVVLRAFANDLNAQGHRAVGLVQVGHHCVDSNLSALLIHTGEQVPLLQDLGTCATGCRLDVGRLLEAGTRIANAIDTGADIVIINRFGKQEREGKGLAYLIERALDADIPVVIAVSSHRFADWIKFASGMSVKLACNRASLEAWWRAVSGRNASVVARNHITVCEAFK